ncbi:hypothetical protein IIU_05944 [Bacillus cereus VD133]|uniref:Uncharacterized protein n=1 Tax=Bacillus cereus VD133 TaxID=1053233 RepID=A0A9W5UZZ4_BACCE|nr:hypothetical protein [Bacillus cereus]EOO27145.1 hypothetical protein IIU_05944 [Bacillus cereus VD133]
MRERFIKYKDSNECIYTIVTEIEFVNGNNCCPEPYGWINIHQDEVATTIWTQPNEGINTPKTSKLITRTDIISNTIPNQLCFSGNVKEYSYWGGEDILIDPNKQTFGTVNTVVKLRGIAKDSYVSLRYQIKLKDDD